MLLISWPNVITLLEDKLILRGQLYSRLASFRFIEMLLGYEGLFVSVEVLGFLDKGGV